MQSFLEETLLDLQQQYQDLSELTLVFPSKRAGAFFKQYLLQYAEKTQFAPTVISIESFIEEIAQLTIIDNTALLFKGYSAYQQLQQIKEAESFESYLGWAQTILNDFNEMDRYLAPPNEFFNYLSAIQDIEHWYVKSKRTPLIENYLDFWKLLPSFYEQLQTQLLAEGIGYQGMVYRKAVEDVEHFRTARTNPIIFIGFNALNNAEQHLIQSFLSDPDNKIYWDLDPYLYQDEQHSASYFLRSYAASWPYYNDRELALPNPTYTKPKTITSIAAQKNMSQVQMAGALLDTLDTSRQSSTAVILADESLLVPLLYSLPESIEQVNVTMGVKLQQFPLYDFFERWLYLHTEKKSVFYYKDIFQLLQHSVSSLFLKHPDQIKNHITANNITSVSLDQLEKIAHPEDLSWIKALFQSYENDVSVLVEQMAQFILKLKEGVQLQRMDRIVLYELFQVVTKIKGLSQHFNYLTSAKTLLQLFQDIASNHTIDFEGDAYNGLQIMGLLETRCLDFETILMLSVNEGILPAGKSNASFITYDMKKAFGLPLYTEKDAIYTYHFYRLLQRAQDITLLYNAFADGLSTGERSRFLLQLELDGHPNHSFRKQLANPAMGVHELPLKEIEKTPKFMERLASVAAKGFSPSALTSYIRNPLEFYFQKILQIKEVTEVEETIAYNTLGTIVHHALEKLYTPLVGRTFSKTNLSALRQDVPEVIQTLFRDAFPEENYQQGKNLIIFQVAQRYVENMITTDLNEVEAGHTITLIALEKELSMEWPVDTIAFPINLRGIVDRIDRKNGTLRIIDYKTGRVTPTELRLTQWEDLLDSYKYSKAFQVLTYTLMLQQEYPEEHKTAGVISFKNLSDGFQAFAKRKENSKATNEYITTETLDTFGEILTQLLKEICEERHPIIEKELT